MKDIIVLKFGGTSMGSAETINSCVDVIEEKTNSSDFDFPGV